MAKKIGIPVAWYLAGDYQNPLEKELEIHRNTMAAASQSALPAKRCSLVFFLKHRPMRGKRQDRVACEGFLVSSSPPYSEELFHASHPRR